MKNDTGRPVITGTFYVYDDEKLAKEHVNPVIFKRLEKAKAAKEKPAEAAPAEEKAEEKLAEEKAEEKAVETKTEEKPAEEKSESKPSEGKAE